MKLDVEKLKFVAEWLEKGAPHEKGGMAFNMDTWYDDYTREEFKEDPWVGECGSVACIGGALEQFFGVDYEWSPEELGASEEQVEDLFYPWGKCSYKNGSQHLSPENCAKVIYKLIETGEVDWGVI